MHHFPLDFLRLNEHIARAGGGGSGAGGGGSGGGGGGSGGGGSGGSSEWGLAVFLFLPFGIISGILLTNAFRYTVRSKRVYYLIIIPLCLDLLYLFVRFVAPLAAYGTASTLIPMSIIWNTMWFLFGLALTIWSIGESLGTVPKEHRQKRTPRLYFQKQLIVRDLFLRYQEDWSNRNPNNFDRYMTPRYASHARLMVQALTDLKRTNRITHIRIEDIVFQDPEDQIQTEKTTRHSSSTNAPEILIASITAKCHDVLLDDVRNKKLYVDNATFTETWYFIKNETEDRWLLDRIQQSTEDLSKVQKDMLSFAQQNSMFFSPDYGWLLIPRRGQLIRHGGFGKSDINNHIIGTYNHVLVQLYTLKNYKQKLRGKLLVGQINVPKEYGGILIRRRKSGLFNLLVKPYGYKKYTFEWSDFNNRYQVYASDSDRLATFELLNPGFMAFLYDNFNNITIEVVDNIIYFYAPKKGNRKDYSELMLLLMKAFKELQL